ncbi:MAG: phosphotransferase family protein [Syntrophales bacterium]|jgi:aminoglycoside phosphotransferase (APT) family kinase protein
MMDFVDKTKPIREGEEVDVPKIEAFLKDSIPGLDGPLEISQFPSGHSNLTYLIKVGNREMIFRRPPVGRKAKSAHDMGREYRILKALRPAFPCCPQPLAYIEDESIIGSPFYVMERISGIILRRELPKGLTYTPDEARQLCENVIDVHVELHKVDYRKIGLENFGKPEGYVKRQVEGWSERYRQARTPDAPESEDVMAWLKEKMPGESGLVSIIHNDYKLDNIVLDPNNPLKVIGVLDWEMATLGDPLMDLGSSMPYWVDADDPDDAKAISMVPTTNMPGALKRMEIVQRYAEKMGISIGNIDFYYCFGMFRLAVIAQQIYYRFYHGQTKDQRLGMMIIGVNVLDTECKRLIAHSRL